MINTYKNIIYLENIDSTNTYAKEMIKKETECPILIYANKQTNGRGRLGRTFVSKNGGVYMSIVFKMSLKDFKPTLVTSYTAVVVSDAIDKITGLKTSIKWVNDIYINNKKLSGILVESVIKNNEAYIIVGIGINVLHQQFDQELKQIVTTIEDEINQKYNPKTFIDEISTSFFTHFNKILTREYINKYREKSCVIGKNIFLTINNEIHQVKAIDIDDEGELIVREKDKTYKTYSGEITKVKINN